MDKRQVAAQLVKLSKSILSDQNETAELLDAVCMSAMALKAELEWIAKKAEEIQDEDYESEMLIEVDKFVGDNKDIDQALMSFHDAYSALKNKAHY